MDYVAVQRSGDIDDTRAFTGHFKSGFINTMSSNLIDAIVDNFEAHPERGGRVGFAQNGGAIGRVGNSETAFASRDAQYVLMSFVGWNTNNDGAEHLKYINEHWSKVHPFTNGFYVNDYFDHTQDMVKDTYGENFHRLLEIKQQYDPTNLFRLNANIKPA